MTARKLAAAVAILAAGSAIGCLGDLLHDRAAKELAGGYCLQLMLETKDYSLQGCRGSNEEKASNDFPSGLQQIGWNESAIVGTRVSTHGDSEWWLLDLETSKVTGPLNDEAMKERLSNDRLLRGIAIRKVEDVLK